MSKVKKKRLLPEWMGSPDKNASARKSGKKTKSIRDFLNPKEKVVSKPLNIDVFDFCDFEVKSEIDPGVKGEQNNTIKPTVYIMSPAELEEVARMVLDHC